MSIAAQIGSFGPRTMDRVNKVRRAVTLKLFGAIVLDTPVDTGRLRANWRPSNKEPVMEARPSTYDKAGALPLAETNKVVAEVKNEEATYLTNNLPYAARIEFDGWSHTKAPLGMVRKNVIRFNKLIDLEAKRREGL